MHSEQLGQFYDQNTLNKSPQDLSPLINPQDETLFKLPSIAAKKHARKMLVNQVRSLGSGPNSNIKALLVVILKIAFGTYLHKDIIVHLKQEMQNPEIKLSKIFNSPNNSIQESKLKSIFVDYLDILTNNLQSHGKQILIENMLTQNPLLAEIMVLLLRYYLYRQQVPNAQDYKAEVETKVAYQIITQIFDINCRINDEYFIFYDDSILIASHDGSEFVYGKFYQNQAEMRKEEKLTASTLQFLNMLSANRNKRSQLLIQSRNSGTSQNSDIVFQPDQFGAPTPSFQRNEDFVFKDNNSQGDLKNKNKDNIRIQINGKPQRAERKTNFIGEVITNIQMIQSRHEQIPLQQTLKRQAKPYNNYDHIQNHPQSMSENDKNNNLFSSKKRQKKTRRQLQHNQYEGYKPIGNAKGRKFLENNEFQIERQLSCRNQSFEFFDGSRRKTQQMDHDELQYQQIGSYSRGDRKKCSCKQIAKTKNKMFSNLYSISINAQASPLRMKTIKSAKQIPAFSKIKKQQKKQQKNDDRKQQNINSSAQFKNIFRRKQMLNSKEQDLIVQSPSSNKNCHFNSHPFLARNHSNENISQNIHKKQEKIEINKKQSKYIEKINFNRNIHALCSPSNKGIKLKNSPRGFEFKTNLKNSQTIQKKNDAFCHSPKTPSHTDNKKKLSVQDIGYFQAKKPFLQFQYLPKTFKMPMKT